MLNDAIGAEALKLRRNLSLVFWGFLFVPLVALVSSLAAAILESRMEAQVGQHQTVDAASIIFVAAMRADGPLTLLFLLIAAASLFSSEYRFETWRLLTPRNRRANLWAAKAIVFASWAAGSLLLVALMAALGGFIAGIASRAPMLWDAQRSLAYLGRVAGWLARAWAEALLIASLAALGAALARSILTALLAPLAILLVEAVARAVQGDKPPPPPDLFFFLERPRVAISQLGAALSGPSGVDVAIPSVALAIWVVGVFAVSAWVFCRQDLARE